MKKEQYWNCVETQFLIQLCWYQHISSFRFYECWKLNSTCASPIVSYCAEHVMSLFFLFLFFVFLLKLQSKSNSDSVFLIFVLLEATLLVSGSSQHICRMEIIEVTEVETLLCYAWLKNTQKVNWGDYRSNAGKKKQKTESFLPPNGPELNKDRVSSSLSFSFSLCGTTLLMDTIM